MLKSFSFNIVLLLGINLIIKPLYIFGVDAQVQNVLGESVYGTYFGLFSFCYLFQVILDPGLQNYNITSVSKDNDLFPIQFPQVIILKTLLGFVFATSIILMAIILGYSSESISLLSKILLLQIMISFALAIRTNLSAVGQYWKDALMSVLDKLVLIVIVFYLFYKLKSTDSFSINDWIHYQMVAFAIVICFSLFLLIPQLKKTHFENIFSGMQKLIKASLPFALVFLLMTLYTKMDGVMLYRLLDDEGQEAGIYAAGFRLYEAANMFAFLFASLLLPMFSSQLKEIDRIKNLCESSLRIIIPFSLIGVLSAIYYGEDIMRLIYIEGDDYYARVFTLLMCSFFMVALSYVYGTLITATAKLKWFNISFIIGIIINWSLNYYLIPTQGAYGAAIATLVTQSFIIASQLFISHQLLPLSINKKMVLQAISLSVLCVLGCYMISELINLNWILCLSLSIILSLLVSFLVGLLRFDITRMVQINS